MSKTKDISHSRRLDKVEYATGVDKRALDMALKLISKYIKDKVSEIEIPDNLSEEEFNNLMPILTLYSLGTFVPSYKKYKYIQQNKLKKEEKWKKVKKEC